MMKNLERTFEKMWENPPNPFNPEYKPHAKAIHAATTLSMEADEYYSNHDRGECKVEWRKRYNARMAEYEANGVFV